jgi:uncharacterized protein DUF5916
VIPLLLAALLADTTGHAGRAGQIAVQPPRLSGDVVIDGVLNEPQWQHAALLTGFSQFTPVDGVAASDSTEVLVWYSATALYLGIRAHDASGTVRATLATRDKIFSDDNVQIFLSTFNDGRQATMFAVNPFGVQADGALNESGTQSCYTGCAALTRQQPDLSPDYVWESKGKLTADGYEVEIRIPFASIRFQSSRTQTWGINFLRVVQRSGQEQTWTPVRRAGSSFLGQSGTLTGLTGLDAGHALDIVPTATTSITGSAPTPGAAFNYQTGSPQIGADARYALTPNLTLHATAHPDFSQVESDVTQFAFDPRQAVFYPEKRPFFLDGVEQFDAPQSLIYTRRIVQPVFAAKMTGEVGNNQVGVLAAVDDRGSSAYGNSPAFGIVRASHDLGPGARVGFTWTEQHDGPELNRVIGGDTRIVLHGIHSVTLLGAVSHDVAAGATRDGALWGAGYRLDGRHVKMNYQITGFGTDFVTRSGFIATPGIAVANLSNSYTWLASSRTVQAITGEVLLGGKWRYDDLIHGGPLQNRYVHFNLNATLRGGWGAGLGYFRESFGYDPSIYTDYGVLHPDGAVTPFTGGNARLPNNDFVVSGNTPAWKAFDLNVFVLTGLNDENYAEWSSAPGVNMIVAMNVRPTVHLRLNTSYTGTHIYRDSDHSRVVARDVLVNTIEYQLTRTVQLRLIAQYSLNARDSLRDESRTGLPIVIRDSSGAYVRAGAYDNRALQLNVLLTYLPRPGTVVYLGYGTLDQRPDLLGIAQLGPVQSEFFVKLSYLWRT